MPPLVSVVMSVYNGERYLRESVDSILIQTFNDFEFIIINDGSTDSTSAILDTYKDNRIILLNQKNAGLTKSLNKGISIAKGKYIARQDADDISKPERFEKEVSFMEENPHVGLLSCWFEFIDETGQVRRQARLPVEDGLLRERLIEINQFSHPGAMIRKEILTHTGLYREYFKYAQDYDLWLRISEKSEISNLPDFLVQYRESAAAISSKLILLQSRYAGVAREMALQRRSRGMDDIQREGSPKLTATKDLSTQLKSKLVNFYESSRNQSLTDRKYLQYIKHTISYYRTKKLLLNKEIK